MPGASRPRPAGQGKASRAARPRPPPPPPPPLGTAPLRAAPLRPILAEAAPPPAGPSLRAPRAGPEEQPPAPPPPHRPGSRRRRSLPRANGGRLRREAYQGAASAGHGPAGPPPPPPRRHQERDPTGRPRPPPVTSATTMPASARRGGTSPRALPDWLSRGAGAPSAALARLSARHPSPRIDAAALRGACWVGGPDVGGGPTGLAALRVFSGEPGPSGGGRRLARAAASPAGRERSRGGGLVLAGQGRFPPFIPRLPLPTGSCRVLLPPGGQL